MRIVPVQETVSNLSPGQLSLYLPEGTEERLCIRMHNTMPEYLSLEVLVLTACRERAINEKVRRFEVRRAFCKLLNRISSATYQRQYR